jgi:hypothetical protein
MAKIKSSKANSSIPKHLIIFGTILIILAVMFVILILRQGETLDQDDNQLASLNNQAKDSEEASSDNRKGDIFNPTIDQIEIVSDLDKAIATTAGVNLITPDSKVVNEEGQVVQNNAPPMTPIAPRLSEPVDPDTLMQGTIKLRADENGFSPNEFVVISGEPVTLSLTSVGVGSRLVFIDSSLVALELPVPTDYTMAKTFNAPSPGEYVFYQDMPGRTDQTGKMIVQ